MDSILANEILLCSDCFVNEGLKLDAKKLGFKSTHPCPSCKSIEGFKLTKDLLLDLCERFFIRGSVMKVDYGGAPQIQFNKQHHKKIWI